MTPAIAVVGWSGSGKTTLILELIKVLSKRGYRLGAIKHTHHTEVKFDEPGKDSYEMKAAGAVAVALVTPQKLLLVRDGKLEITDFIQRDFADVDLVLVEGGKDLPLSKILLERDGTERLKLNQVIACLRSPFTMTEVLSLADLVEARFLR